MTEAGSDEGPPPFSEHPDPDDPATRTPRGTVHTCDGCCAGVFPV
jgi:hypothetical protein